MCHESDYHEIPSDTPLLDAVVNSVTGDLIVANEEQAMTRDPATKSFEQLLHEQARNMAPKRRDIEKELEIADRLISETIDLLREPLDRATRKPNTTDDWYVRMNHVDYAAATILINALNNFRQRENN